MKNLQLSLKGKWFLMTDPNGKTEDYREINEYWVKRLIEPTDEDVKVSDVIYYLNGGELDHFKNNNFKIKEFATNIMTLGYPKSTDTSRIKIFEHKGIEIGYGKEEFGAEPNRLYFIIKHGKRLQ